MEIWECQNCNYRGQLTQHGKCARCGSSAVFTEHLRDINTELHNIFTDDELKTMFGLFAGPIVGQS